GDPRSKMLRDEAFERRSPNLGWTIERSARAQGTEHAGVEEIELRLLCRLPFRATREHRQAEREQQIFENFYVGNDRVPLGLGFASHVGDVQHRSVRKSD